MHERFYKHCRRIARDDTLLRACLLRCRLADLAGHTGPVNDVCWAPNLGRTFNLIATASSDQHVKIWKLQPVHATSSPRHRHVTNTSLPRQDQEQESVAPCHMPHKHVWEERLCRRHRGVCAPTADCALVGGARQTRHRHLRLPQRTHTLGG